MLTRRTIVQLGIGTLALPAQLPALERTPQLIDPESDVLLGGGKYIDGDAGNKLRFALGAFNVRHEIIESVETGFFPHSVAVDPRDRARICVFEKIGPGAAEIDLHTLTVTRPITTSPDRLFYGHGAYSAGGDRLYATETYRKDKRGVIAVRDSASMDLDGEFPTFGESPHECRLIDDGAVMVVTNGGSALGGRSAPNVCYIDIASERLLDKVELTNPRLNTGHLDIAADGSLVVVSAPRAGLAKTDTGGVSMRPNGSVMRSLAEPRALTAAMTGEALSVAIHNESGLVAVTHPDAGMLTFWRYKDASPVKTLKLRRPRGVALAIDGKRFLVAYDDDARVSAVDVATLRLASWSVPYTYISGSHILNWSLV